MITQLQNQPLALMLFAFEALKLSGVRSAYVSTLGNVTDVTLNMDKPDQVWRTASDLTSPPLALPPVTSHRIEDLGARDVTEACMMLDDTARVWISCVTFDAAPAKEAM